MSPNWIQAGLSRLRDRNKLIDEARVIAEVKHVLQRGAMQRLEVIKNQLSAEDFVQGYDTLKTYRCLDLLNEVPLLPQTGIGDHSGLSDQERQQREFGSGFATGQSKRCEKRPCQSCRPG